ncbi:APC family permease, partial [Klebsiella pneumoniae]|nr:APC family permease [Klebsiella pneumoniae]
VLHAAPWALVIGAVGIGLFSYNGYGPAVLLAEDMKCGGKGVHKAVLWSLGLVVIIELVPISPISIRARPALK